MPEENPLSPSLEGIARRQSGTQQWQGAIEQQRQREAMAPSTGQQVGDIINWNLNRALTGNPLAMVGQMYQDIRSGKLSSGTPEGAARSAKTALALLLEGSMAGQQGYGTGMRGGVRPHEFGAHGQAGMAELIDAWRRKQLPTDSLLMYIRANHPEQYEAIVSSLEKTQTLGESPGLEDVINSVLNRLDPRLRS